MHPLDVPAASLPAEDGPHITQADALRDRFLHSYREGKTRKAYAVDLANWYGYCERAGLDPMKARRLHVEDWVRTVEETRTRNDRPPMPATVHRMVSTVRCLYSYAIEHELLTTNPVPRVRTLNLAKVPPVSTREVLTQDEAARFLEAAKARGPRDAAMAAVFLYQAIRVGELCALDVEHLSSEGSHRTITVHLKGGDIRVAALSPSAATYIDAWLATRMNPDAGKTVIKRTAGSREGTPLFINAAGGRVNHSNVEWFVKQTAKDAGIEKRISPHSLRHTAITQALTSGVSLRDVQILAGHCYPSTTMRYDRRVQDLNNSPVYKIDGVFG